MEVPPTGTRYRVTGMDCADDAAEIEHAVREVDGVVSAKVSVATQVLTLAATDDARDAAENAVQALGYQLTEMRTDATRAHITPAYTRALWIVVLLNIGYGVVEMMGGFISGSQALKADALDFLGDGAITLLGIVAIGWSMAARARSALLQGVFLGALGIGVIATTIHRVLVRQSPEPELMGILGSVALLVNVAAAYVLIPHRTGDANVRAVWLFSRNDAIGNAAVVLAAGLVAWTQTAWPDLLVAIALAGLFLHSAWSIVRDAMAELRAAS